MVGLLVISSWQSVRIQDSHEVNGQHLAVGGLHLAGHPLNHANPTYGKTHKGKALPKNVFFVKPRDCFKNVHKTKQNLKSWVKETEACLVRPLAGYIKCTRMYLRASFILLDALSLVFLSKLFRCEIKCCFFLGQTSPHGAAGVPQSFNQEVTSKYMHVRGAVNHQPEFSKILMVCL